MEKYYRVVTDGKIFRITARAYGGDDVFVHDLFTGMPLEFDLKAAAEAYIHDRLSMNGWKKAE